MQHKIHQTRYVLCIIARRRGAEVGVFEGVPYPYSVRRVKPKQFAYKVEERPVVIVDRDDDLLYIRVKISIHNPDSNQTYLKRLGRLDVLFTLLGRLSRGPIEFIILLKILCLLRCAFTCKTLRHAAHDHLHHGQMLEVVVRLVQRDAGVKLDEDAP